MDRTAAVYVSELIEALLRAEPGTPMGNARDSFMLSHGNYGLKMLFEGEKQLRKEWSIPDSKGQVDITE